MPRIFAISLSLLLSVFVYGQRKFNLDSLFLKRGLLGIEAGPSIPIMDYGLASQTTASGYAKTGYQVRVSFSYELRRLGFKISYLYNNNPFDDDALTKDIQDYYKNTGVKLNFTRTNPWILSGLMGGIFVPVKLSRSTYNLKVMAGVMSSVYPQQDYDYTVTGNNAHVVLRVDEVSSNGMAYLAGIDYKYRIYKDLLFTAYLDFMYSEQTFEGLTVKNASTGAPVSSSTEYTQYYQIIVTGVGLAMQFD